MSHLEFGCGIEAVLGAASTKLVIATRSSTAEAVPTKMPPITFGSGIEARSGKIIGNAHVGSEEAFAQTREPGRRARQHAEMHIGCGIMQILGDMTAHAIARAEDCDRLQPRP